MTGPSLDLDALREKADRLAAIDACEWSFGDNETELMVDMTPQFRDECVEAMLAVLSLVEDLRAENERLREALERIEQICNGAWSHESITHIASGALAGSLAANEEQQ